MKVYLAPMEGLADVYLREIISQAGGYDLIVTEFVRVVDQTLPNTVFLRQIPELLNNGMTRNGTPVRVQLLGNHAQQLAENALTAVALGSHGIDLNFGCPSKTVNSSKGGAILLKEPETIYRAVKAVAEALDGEHTLSAKMRLGYEDDSRMLECADAIYQAGANELVIHARTKAQGYTPPAYWHLVEQITQSIPITTVINGEIWSKDDATLALRQSGSQHVMVGRGAVRNPLLARQIKEHKVPTQCWRDVFHQVENFWERVTSDMPERYCAGRLKQWLSHLKENHTEADELFLAIQKMTRVSDINEVLAKRSNDF